MNNEAANRATYHECGGTIIVGGSGEYEHQCCTRCGAYTYDMGGEVPSGTDAAANQAAYDTGDYCSPDAE